ncbi:hypothetical protein F2Q70_00045310 [Brassica cretica]|uniref:Uncharacterized protein n=1 Tax=Brassica cretica TaxID=69181 RepID=A0A8S9KG25_BRACR|nr:hypothetical protein F2Q70_00045310 [Brassica cretica]
MGQYSYSQPSSSSEDLDITSLLEAEAQLYADEAQSSFDTAEPLQLLYCREEKPIRTSSSLISVSELQQRHRRDTY